MKVRRMVVCFLILAFILSFIPTKIVYTSVGNLLDKQLIMKELSDIIKDWYFSNRSADFRNIKVEVTLAKDIQPLKIENGKAEAVFYVHATMIPKATFGDVEQDPFLKGMQKYLDKNKGKLTPAQIETIKFAIKERIESLKDTVGRIHEENGTFKVVCNITSQGEIDKSSAKIFYDISAKGEPIWEDVNIAFLPQKPSEDEEEEGFLAVDNLMNELYPSDQTVSINSTYQNFYTRSRARDYADTYTSEAPESKTITCWDPTTNSPKISKFTDISHWNNSQYPLPTDHGYYANLACNNCADFVSQAMYYAGMRADDSYWNPSTRLTGYKGKWCWTYIPDLLWRMKTIRGDWTKLSSYNDLKIGDVAVFYYIGRDGAVHLYHVAIVDNFSNTYGFYAYFAAHTNDVKQHYYPASYKYFYSVSCWRFAP